MTGKNLGEPQAGVPLKTNGGRFLKPSPYTINIENVKAAQEGGCFNNQTCNAPKTQSSV